MKILIGCEFPEPALAELRTLSENVVYKPGLAPKDLEKEILDTGILVVGRNRVTPEAISGAKSLQMIIRAGTNTTNIAIPEASDAGVFVANCPHKDAIAIAEMVFGMLIALDRRLLEASAAMRGGTLAEALAEDATGLAGRTLGMLGFGPVELALAKRARAFGMKTIAWSPTLTPEAAAEAGMEFGAWPREVARRSDMVSIYAPEHDRDEILVDEVFLRDLRKGAYLVYTGSPVALDQDALIEVAQERELRVAYDLFTPQIPTSNAGRFQSRLQALQNAIGTNHLGDRTQQAVEATAMEVVRIVRSFLVTGELVNCINLVEHSPATWQLVLRLEDTVGVLASILDHIRADGINIEEMVSRVFTGARAAWCLIALDERPSTDALDAIRELRGVLHLELRALI
ncbi:NAD(P)-dependent oxidoreductase [uncultured Ilyobacter sp.]|uniref:NAD(P)-dependent oxidoreductase n=1 Tax=uncultured Ilyobacter sp. TaxID=544433 RepID=UPI0029F56C81|nr:NAD(P)-dependent oxidoreductase [uncultured Ilyobacter sp.]